MRKAQTHFEQVPLVIVKTIIEEQIRQEANLEQDQRSREKMVAKKGLATAKQCTTEPGTSSQAEANKEVHEAQQ